MWPLMKISERMSKSCRINLQKGEGDFKKIGCFEKKANVECNGLVDEEGRRSARVEIAVIL